MLKEVLTSFLKFTGAVFVLAVVWVAAGEYQRQNFRDGFDEAIQIRVRQECVRPASIQTLLQAQHYDLTLRELDLVGQQLDFIQRRTSVLLDHADRIEALRKGMTQSKLPPALGGVGGPAPDPKSR